MPNVSPQDRKVIKKRSKNLFKKDLEGTVAGVNEGVGYKTFMADAQAARDRVKKKVEDRKKKDAAFVDRQKKGIPFSDKQGKGYIRGGKKVYS